MTFDLNQAINQAWEDRCEHRPVADPRITVVMHLDGPRDLSVTVPNDFGQWPPDQQCAVIDRIKAELLGSSIEISTRYSENEYWEQPGRYSLPCDPPHQITKDEQ